MENLRRGKKKKEERGGTDLLAMEFHKGQRAVDVDSPGTRGGMVVMAVRMYG